MKRYLPAICFSFAIALGFGVATRSWNGSLFVYMGAPRAPASVRSVRDYSTISRQSLFKPVHEQMLADATVIRREGFVGVNLGHPLFKKGKGGGDFACSVQGRPGFFDRVELTWTGVGISDSGEPPVMSVEVPCAPGATLNELATIWIPMRDIIAAPARDQELQLFGDHPILVRLQSIPGQWPEGWVLQSVRMFSEENPDEAFSIGTAEIREANPKRLAFDYK